MRGGVTERARRDRARLRAWVCALAAIALGLLLPLSAAQAQVTFQSSTTSLGTSPNPSNLGQSVTLTATVTNNDATFVPTGTVTFTDLTTGTTLGSNLVIGANGPIQTSINVSTLTAGTHSLQASFSGGNYIGGGSAFTVTGSNSNIVPQVVNQAGTATTVSSSQNPSTSGQPVTFTATVTGSSPSGTVAFFDGGAQIGTGTVSGGTATFTTSSLAVGSHSITAHYGGDTNNAPSISAALIQTVGVSTDSLKLRAMQVSTTPIVANISGQAISGAIDGAIGAGFSGNPAPLTPNGSGFTYYFDADPQARRNAADDDGLKRFLTAPDAGNKKVADDFAALGYAGPGSMPTKAPPPPSTAPREWLAWIDVRGTDYDRSTFGDDLKGTQVNAIAGLTRRITPDFLVGILAGYEHFDYSSLALTSMLKGDGWTTGAYMGWRLAPNLRFDAAAAWSDIFANTIAGTAAGNFTGQRWLVSGGLTGTYGWQAVVLEPSARVYALWERENAYTDSLGTLQSARDFSTGRASAGVKAIYPVLWSSTVNLAPYAGLYGDYYFSMDNAAAIGLTTVPLLQGWSARATGGVVMTFAGGSQLSAGGEFGGIGGNTRIWTWRARGYVPF